MKKFALNVEGLEPRQLLSAIKASIQPTSINSALISWMPVKGIKVYLVQEAFQAFKTVKHHKVAYTKWVTIAQTKQTNINIGGLLPSHGYVFDVVAKGRPATKSKPLGVVTPAPPPPLPAPGALNLVSTTTGTNTIHLQWTASSNAAYYSVYILSGGQWIAFANTTGTVFDFWGLASGTNYSFAICARNNSGATWSNVSSATTTKLPPGITTTHPTTSVAGYRYIVGPDSLWFNNPVWSDVHQHSIGDCWLESAMSEVAYRTPNVVKSVFTDLGYYTENFVTVHCWNVRLYDSSYKPHYITVDNEFPVDSSGNWIGNGNESGQIWACLIEKAYVIAAQLGYVTITGTPNGSYESLNSGVASWALRAITGHYASQAAFTKNSITDAGLINNAYAGNFYICILTTTPVSSHIDATHYYSILTVTPGSPNASYSSYLIDNPWNTADGTYYGSVFTCNGTFLSQNWSYYDTCWF